MQMDALRSWWEIPSIAHFCSLFRAAFQLPDFDIEDLEDGLLAAASEEGSPFLEDLFSRLLQGCYGRDDIEPYNFEIYLKDIMKGLAVQLNIENPIETRSFREIGLRQKVEILQHLCDSRLDSLDVMDQLKGFEGDNMRVEPLGKDSSGATYWYFYGSRLYKEDAEPVVEEQTKEKKTRKKVKERDKKTKGKKRGRKSTKTSKAKGKRESKQATRTSSRTSTRVSSRLRALEEKSMEEEEDEEEEEEEEESEEEEEVMHKEEEKEEEEEKIECSDERKCEEKNETKQGEEIKEKVSDEMDCEVEKQENDTCERKTEEQDLKSESESQNPDEIVKKTEDDEVDEKSAEDSDLKMETKQESEKTAMETEDGDKKEDGNTNQNNSNVPAVCLGLPLPEVNPRWHLICRSYEDWDALAESFKESKIKCERDLCRCITQDFLPAIPEIMEAREKERKKRLLETAPKRTSTRISIKQKELAEQEAILAEAEAEEEKQRKIEEEERRKLLEIEREEEEKRLREERQKNREERARRLEQREQRAQLIAEGKEIPPELQYTASTYNSKYREEEEGQQPELDDEDIEEMEKVLEAVKSHKDAWPFMEPVDEEVAPGYHDVVKKPMDLSLIEKKLTSRVYKTKKRFIRDFSLMCDNCCQFNGVESDLGMMAQKLQRYVNKAVRVHIDKVKDSYQADDEFRIAQTSVRAEKKYRPKRAASSRAMDTLHRAMNYNDDFDQFDSDDDDSDRSQSPKPYRDKILRLDPPTPTKPSRLIPELSANADEIGWSGEQRTIKQVDKVGNPAWNVDGNVVSFNGKKLLYNFSKHNRQTSATSLSLLDAKKYSPYVNKNETKSETSLTSGTDNTEIKDTAFHQGHKFVYQVKKSSKPKLPGNSIWNAKSSSPNKSPKEGLPKVVKQLGPSGMVQLRQLNVGPGGMTKTRPAGSQMVAKHGQSGGTVQIGSPSTGSPRLSVAGVSPTGQRIIKIVTAPGQQPLQPGQVINLAELGLVGGQNKAIKLSGSLLQLKGQNASVPVSGKTRIVYQGSVTKTVTSNTSVSDSPTTHSGSGATGTEKPAIITLGPSSGLSPLSANKQSDNTSASGKVTSVETHGFTQIAQRSTVSSASSFALSSAAKSVTSTLGHTPLETGLSKKEEHENKSTLGHSPNAASVIPSEVQNKVSPPSTELSVAQSEENKDILGHPPSPTTVTNSTPVITKPMGDQSPDRSSDDDIPELFPMNPPQQPPKKRKTTEGSPSPSKVFIQGVSTSPTKPSNHSPPKSPVASHSPKFSMGGSSKMNSPPKLFPQSILDPPKLTCPPRIRSPPKTSGPPKLTPVQPLDSANGHHSDWKQSASNKFAPNKGLQSNGPSEDRKSVFDTFDIGGSNAQGTTSSEQSAQQEPNSENVNKLICDSGDKTTDSVPKADTQHEREQEKTSPACVHNNVSANSDSDSIEDRLCGLESKSETSKKSPDKGNLFDNFATFLQTPPKLELQQTSESVSSNLFNSQTILSSSSSSSNSSSSASLSSSSPFSSSTSSSSQSSHYSGRSIFDSMNAVPTHENNAAKQNEVSGGLTQNMMAKVSTFAANLHMGSLASKLGSLSPSKSSTANSHHLRTQESEQSGEENT